MTKDIKQFIEQVMIESCHAIRVRMGDVKSTSRRREVVRARYIGWMIIYDLTADLKDEEGHRLVTLRSIGEAYGGFDHSTVLYGKNTAFRKVWGDDINPPLIMWAKAYEEIMTEISQPVAEILGKDEQNTFFPYTPTGYANARQFLWDIGEFRFRNTSMEQLIIFANQRINKYRL